MSGPPSTQRSQPESALNQYPRNRFHPSISLRPTIPRPNGDCVAVHQHQPQRVALVHNHAAPCGQRMRRETFNELS